MDVVAREARLVVCVEAVDVRNQILWKGDDLQPHAATAIATATATAIATAISTIRLDYANQIRLD